MTIAFLRQPWAWFVAGLIVGECACVLTFFAAKAINADGYPAPGALPAGDDTV